MSWTVDLIAHEARHESGLVVRFEPHPDGGWDGKVVAGTIPLGDGGVTAARLLREAGDEFSAALKAARQ